MLSETYRSLLRSLAVIVVEEAAKPPLASNRSIGFIVGRRMRRANELTAQPLMIPFEQVVLHVLTDHVSEVLLTEKCEVIETFVLYGLHKALCERIAVRTFGPNLHGFYSARRHAGKSRPAACRKTSCKTTENRETIELGEFLYSTPKDRNENRRGVARACVRVQRMGLGRLRNVLWPRPKPPTEMLPDDAVEVPPYRLLAPYWRSPEQFLPEYSELVPLLLDKYNLHPRSVLSLACGTGEEVAYWAERSERVMGLDLSADMLEEARRRHPGILERCWVRADFRSFHLDTGFDLVICGGDSLNYVRDSDELRSVFGCVSRHLHSKGLFVFDAVTALQMKRMSSSIAVVGNRTSRFFFNEVANREESITISGPEFERHFRVPIEIQEVESEARRTGLAVKEYFSTDRIEGPPYPIPLDMPRVYYVLSKGKK